MTDVNSFVNRIRWIAPELQITSTRMNNEGLSNDVILVNEQFVFRFPKNERGRQQLAKEAEILRLLRRYITLQTPEPLYQHPDLLGYRLIPGEPLRRDVLMKLETYERQKIADQLAEFLLQMHAIPFAQVAPESAKADCLMDYENWKSHYERIRKTVFPLLQEYQRQWASQLYETQLADKKNFEYQQILVHTDLTPYHILFDPENKRLSGIIDFGCAGVGDPALDVGLLIYFYGQSFVNLLYKKYPAIQTHLDRARFYASAMELRWLLTGLERDDPMWFAVHIGSARDIGDIY